MIRHIVGFRFKPETTPEQITDFLGAFRCLGEQIPELRTLTVGPNLTDRDAGRPRAIVFGDGEYIAAVTDGPDPRATSSPGCRSTGWAGWS